METTSSDDSVDMQSHVGRSAIRGRQARAADSVSWRAFPQNIPNGLIDVLLTTSTRGLSSKVKPSVSCILQRRPLSICASCATILPAIMACLSRLRHSTVAKRRISNQLFRTSLRGEGKLVSLLVTLGSLFSCGLVAQSHKHSQIPKLQSSFSLLTIPICGDCCKTKSLRLVCSRGVGVALVAILWLTQQHRKSEDGRPLPYPPCAA